MYLSSIDSFLNGYKPSCYENRTKLNAVKRDDLQAYPHYNDNDEFTIYFHNETLKQRFLNAIHGLERTSAEYIKVFGDVLGYPPRATAFYSDYIARRQTDVTAASNYFQSVRVNMLYCGVQFMAHVEDVEENALWLWDRYQYTKPMRFKLFSSGADHVQLVINYRDHDGLKRGVDECMSFLNYQPIYT